MTIHGKCGLCDNTKDLQQSHIIPSFAYKWLKKSLVTGYLRFGETPNKRVQDGAKMFLLCIDCEQLFSSWEDTFAKELFIPLHQGESIKPYGKWLLKFSTSISWRVLTLFKNHLDLNHFPDNLLSSVDNALLTWKEFLLDKRPHPAIHEQHILPFQGYIGDHNDPDMPSNINRYISRSIDIDAACSKTEAFVYIKMCRLLLIGFIEMKHPERWRHTKIHVNRGSLERKHYKVPATVRNFLYYKAQRAQKVQSKMSDKQWARIGEDYKKNADKYSDSEMFKAMTQDAILFGEAAFGDEPFTDNESSQRTR